MSGVSMNEGSSVRLLSPQEPKVMGEKLSWDPGYKQAVYFLPPHSVDGEGTVHSLKYSVRFQTATGQLNLLFSANYSH